MKPKPIEAWGYETVKDGKPVLRQYVSFGSLELAREQKYDDEHVVPVEIRKVDK